jgi:Cu(I)/Ag(I) efflux system membrane protein CusA/SilA
VIQRIIEFSANNRWIVMILVGVCVLLAVRAVQSIPLDAIPDLSDTQVIVYSRWDRSPDIVEDQVTYPVITSLLGVPSVKSIRGFSDFGFSYVYVIFEDGTDIYWARSRVLEYLSKILPRLPEGVKTELGPDATGVGWVYQYALQDRTGKHDLASCAPSRTGTSATGWPVSRVWPRSRPSEGSRSSTRCSSTPSVCRP